MTSNRRTRVDNTEASDPEAGIAARARRAGSRTLFYLYGVVAAGTPAHELLAARRVPGVEPGQPLAGGGAGGEPGKPLFPIEDGGLVAAVSQVPAAIFREEALNALVRDL